MPAMSVLTFVENAVKHQMKQKETLFISGLGAAAGERRDQVFLRVQDNGTGFTRKKYLTQLQKGERRLSWRKTGDGIACEQEHIGIKNLMQRMKILYGEQASLVF